MKISSYYPEFYYNDLDAALKSYTEDLGFKCLHCLDDGWVKLYVLELNGYRVDIFTSDREELQMKDGYYGMHINVDDFEEGMKYYGDRGYKVELGPTESPSVKIAVLINDDGDRLFLYKHIKKEGYADK